jgi:hypothetical protein
MRPTGFRDRNIPDPTFSALSLSSANALDCDRCP